MTETCDCAPAGMPAGCPAIRRVMMPRDTNYHGTIFGGIILSHLDQAGAVAALGHGCHRVVTVAMDKVEFKEREGFSLTYLPFIARAVVDAIPHFVFARDASEIDVAAACLQQLSRPRVDAWCGVKTRTSSTWATREP